MSNKTIVYIARHGETLWNKEKRIQGHKGVGLSAKGHRQAEALASEILLKKYPISKIYSSHLSRALETASIIANALGLEVQVHPGLAERNFGVFEGKTLDELEGEFQNDRKLWWEITPEGGEAIDQFADRSIKTFREIVEAHQGEHVLIVSRGGTIRNINQHINGQNPNLNNMGFDIGNASLYIHEVK